jgi:hypothetical protein
LNKVNFKIFSLLVVLGFLTFASKNYSYGQSYEVGGGLGTSVYSGDMIRKIDPGQAGLQGTLFGKRNFDNVWSLRVGVSIAEIRANDALKPIDPVAVARNLTFDSRVTEFSALMEFNFLDYVNNYSEFRYSPYAFFGLGNILFKGVDDKNKSTLVIPFGGGLNYLLSDQLTLGIELGFRPTTSDELDKLVSTLPTAGTSPAVAKIAGFGNPATKDWTYSLGLTLSYTINKVRCYTD